MKDLESSTSYNNWGETSEGIYITLILKTLGLSEEDFKQDPFYDKEIQLKGYPIDTLVNLLISRNLLIENDYELLRSGRALNGLIQYYMQIGKRYQGISGNVNQILQ